MAKLRHEHRSPSQPYKNYRFPVEIISHAVQRYFRFCLNFRDVEELLLERGVVVTSEAIRKWWRKFGQRYANQLRRRRPRLGDKWHLDEGAPRTHSQLAGAGSKPPQAAAVKSRCGER